MFPATAKNRPWVVLAAVMAAANVHGEAQPFTASEPKNAVQVITESKTEYTVNVGGLLDMDNTMTREGSTFKIAFQNNRSLTIANTGDIPVVNPCILTNGARDWGDIDAMLTEFTWGAETQQDKIYLIWEHMRQNRHHDDPLFGDDEFHDPVRWMNVYGGGLCDDAGMCGSALYHHAGFNAQNGGEYPFVRCLHGHMQCEVFYDGDFQFMDIDENVFYLDRENRKPVSGDALARDHDLAKRELPYGPILGSWEASQNNAALFGIDDGRTRYGVTGHRMDYTLRPGERMVFRWDNIGKWAWAHTQGPHRFYGNSKLIYEPRLETEQIATAAEALNAFTADDGALTCTQDSASALFRTDTPYTICGGTASASFAGARKDTVFRVQSSVNGKDFTTVWEGHGPEAQAEAALDTALRPRGDRPKRTHWLRFDIANGKGARLTGIRIETDLVTSPLALPRLAAGANRVQYTDGTREPHQVTITHEWVESSNITPPGPPQAPLTPEPGQTVHATHVPFRWPAVQGCDAYWIRVSRRPDCAYPYRPNYDLVVPASEHLIEKRGMFSPGETYYWRVRPRLASGVWGSWSPIWTFQWEGPMVPRNLGLRQEGPSFAVSWEANPGGTRPVRYDVYGSDERGFSVNRETHQVIGLGQVPGNFMASTTDTWMTVAGPGATGPNTNKAYYRVVAIDAQGAESCPSDYIELPHPHVYSQPVTQAVAEEEYAYPIETIRSIGDLQSRYEEPTKAYRECEQHLFRLEKGPAWLRLGETTGLLTGTPTASDLGESEVLIRITVAYPREVSLQAKSGRDFHKRHAATEAAPPCEHRFTLTVRAQQ